MEAILNPWPWYVSGPLLAGILATMLYLGKTFGFSSNFRTICAMGGAGKFSSFFDYDWKQDSWNLLFLVGTVIGALIASQFLMNDHSVILNPNTEAALKSFGLLGNADSYVPGLLFDSENIFKPKILAVLIGGGILIGFGTRYAGGCTSGHAISGLSNLQWPSLIAVIGFFIGGLVMTHFLMPMIF